MDGPESSTPRERSPPGSGEAHPAASQTIYAGRYAVVRELDEGGMGRILLARDPRIGRDVALKVLRPGRRDEKQLRRFEQEARAAGGLNHPNILTVFDVGEHEGEPYIVTELLTGTTLREGLKDGPLEPARAVRLATDLAEGLVAAHEHGIVHRDLKPENLFILRDGRLKILDFGIARLPREGASSNGQSTDAHAAVGTVTYMSPEQVRGREVDARSDLFAFGSVLYEMVSGTAPFHRATALASGHAIVAEVPAPLPEHVPADVAAIALRCLNKEPSKRFQSARELGEALARSGPATPALRRRRTIAIASAMLVSALASAAFVTFALPRMRVDGAGRVPDMDVVAVLPFTVRGGGSSAYLGEGMVDLLSTTLATTATKTVDPHALLALMAREKWAADPERGRTVASRFGAGRYVLGSVIEVGTRLRIHASIYDSRKSDAPLREAKVEGEAASIFQLVDDLSAQIREGGSVGRRPDRTTRLAEATTSSPEALAAYLDGKRLYRAGAEKQAHDAFKRAIAADRTFALAYFEAAKGDHWMSGSFDLESLNHAVELSKGLPEGARKQVAAWADLAHGRYVEAERLARELVAEHPEDIDNWHLLAFSIDFEGLRYPAGRTGEDAFQKIHILDPRAVEGLTNPAAAAILSAHYDQAVVLIDRIIDPSGPTMRPGWGPVWRWLRAVITADPDARLQALRDFGRSGDRFLAAEAWQFSVWIPGGLELNGELLDFMSEADAPKEVRVFAEQLRAWNERFRGRIRSHKEHLEAASRIKAGKPGTHDTAASTRFFLYVPVSREQLLAERAEVAALESGPDTPLWRREARLSDLAELDAALADVESVERLVPQFETGDWGWQKDSTFGSDYAAWVRAAALWKAGRAAHALPWLEKIRGQVPLQPYWYWFSPRVTYLKGEVLLQLGREEEAAKQFEIMRNWDAFMVPRYWRLAQIEDRRGNKEKAIWYWKRVVEFWKDCDPELRPKLEEAQGRLAALGQSK